MNISFYNHKHLHFFPLSPVFHILHYLFHYHHPFFISFLSAFLSISPSLSLKSQMCFIGAALLFCQHISHGSDVALHSILYRICHAETLQDINIYSSAPHHCCLKLHLFHTLSYSSQILSPSHSRFISYVFFYFLELIFYIFL